MGHESWGMSHVTRESWGMSHGACVMFRDSRDAWGSEDAAKPLESLPATYMNQSSRIYGIWFMSRMKMKSMTSYCLYIPYVRLDWFMHVACRDSRGFAASSRTYGTRMKIKSMTSYCFENLRLGDTTVSCRTSWERHVAHMTHIPLVDMSHLSRMSNYDLLIRRCHATHYRQRHVVRTNESRMSHVVKTNESRMNKACRTYQWITNEACRKKEWVTNELGMSQIQMSHVPGSSSHICNAYEWVMPHIQMSHAAHMDESCRTYGWATL